MISGDKPLSKSAHLSDDAIERLSRNILLPGLGASGQASLSASTALVVGLGGLGSPVAYYLAAAGVGRLILADGERLDRSNLNRQILHRDADVGRLKVESAEETLRRFYPALRLEKVPHRLNADTARPWVRESHVVVDGSDNFPTRYTMNRLCAQEGRPYITGGALGWEGQVLAVVPGRGPCYECVFPDPPDPESVRGCSQQGVLGGVTGVVGSWMSVEAIKALVNPISCGTGRLRLFDLLKNVQREVVYQRRDDCPACGMNPSCPGTKAFRESVERST